MQEQERCQQCKLRLPEGIVAFEDEGDARPPRSRVLVERGLDRFERFCAACHGVLGDGDSDVARVMTLRKPPSLVDAHVREFDDARIFAVITNGYGVMPSYRTALAPDDRWAVVELVRVLQQREVAVDTLSPDEREEAKRWLP
jgi:mono/diheme cytochrome c family protein